MSIVFLESMGKIRKITPDPHRARSLIESAERTMKIISAIVISSETSTIIFRETYECIRQLGDARWWSIGYKPNDHEVSMEILKSEKILHSAKLAKLDRFKSIRHHANYGGYIVPETVAKEILEFWNECGKEILKKLKGVLSRP